MGAHQLVGLVTGMIPVITSVPLLTCHVTVCKKDGAGRCGTKWLGIICQKFLTLLSSNNTIEYTGELSYDGFFIKS